MEVEQPIMEQPEEKIVSRKRKVSKGNCYTYFFVANKLHQKFISQICRLNVDLIILIIQPYRNDFG